MLSVESVKANTDVLMIVLVQKQQGSEDCEMGKSKFYLELKQLVEVLILELFLL